MNSPFRPQRKVLPQCGVHANGRQDHLEATSAAIKLRAEEARLGSRIAILCHPGNPFGHLFLHLRRRRLISDVRKRFEVPDAMFVARDRTEEGKRGHDPLND